MPKLQKSESTCNRDSLPANLNKGHSGKISGFLSSYHKLLQKLKGRKYDKTTATICARYNLRCMQIVKNNKTPHVYLDAIRTRLLPDYHASNCEVAALEGKYPFTETFKEMLVLYVKMELNCLKTDAPDRITGTLMSIFYDIAELDRRVEDVKFMTVVATIQILQCLDGYQEIKNSLVRKLALKLSSPVLNQIFDTCEGKNVYECEKAIPKDHPDLLKIRKAAEIFHNCWFPTFIDIEEDDESDDVVFVPSYEQPPKIETATNVKEELIVVKEERQKQVGTVDLTESRPVLRLSWEVKTDMQRKCNRKAYSNTGVPKNKPPPSRKTGVQVRKCTDDVVMCISDAEDDVVCLEGGVEQTNDKRPVDSGNSNDSKRKQVVVSSDTASPKALDNQNQENANGAVVELTKSVAEPSTTTQEVTEVQVQETSKTFRQEMEVVILDDDDDGTGKSSSAKTCVDVEEIVVLDDEVREVELEESGNTQIALETNQEHHKETTIPESVTVADVVPPQSEGMQQNAARPGESDDSSDGSFLSVDEISEHEFDSDKPIAASIITSQQKEKPDETSKSPEVHSEQTFEIEVVESPKQASKPSEQQQDDTSTAEIGCDENLQAQSVNIEAEDQIESSVETAVNSSESTIEKERNVEAEENSEIQQNYSEIPEKDQADAKTVTGSECVESVEETKENTGRCVQDNAEIEEPVVQADEKSSIPEVGVVPREDIPESDFGEDISVGNTAVEGDNQVLDLPSNKEVETTEAFVAVNEDVTGFSECGTGEQIIEETTEEKMKEEEPSATLLTEQESENKRIEIAEAEIIPVVEEKLAVILEEPVLCTVIEEEPIQPPLEQSEDNANVHVSVKPPESNSTHTASEDDVLEISQVNDDLIVMDVDTEEGDSQASVDTVSSSEQTLQEVKASLQKQREITENKEESKRSRKKSDSEKSPAANVSQNTEKAAALQKSKRSDRKEKGRDDAKREVEKESEESKYSSKRRDSSSKYKIHGYSKKDVDRRKEKYETSWELKNKKEKLAHTRSHSRAKSPKHPEKSGSAEKTNRSFKPVVTADPDSDVPKSSGPKLNEGKENFSSSTVLDEFETFLNSSLSSKNTEKKQHVSKSDNDSILSDISDGSFHTDSEDDTKTSDKGKGNPEKPKKEQRTSKDDNSKNSDDHHHNTSARRAKSYDAFNHGHPSSKSKRSSTVDRTIDLENKPRDKHRNDKGEDRKSSRNNYRKDDKKSQSHRRRSSSSRKDSAERCVTPSREHGSRKLQGEEIKKGAEATEQQKHNSSRKDKRRSVEKCAVVNASETRLDEVTENVQTRQENYPKESILKPSSPPETVATEANKDAKDENENNASEVVLKEQHLETNANVEIAGNEENRCGSTEKSIPLTKNTDVEATETCLDSIPLPPESCQQEFTAAEGMPEDCGKTVDEVDEAHASDDCAKTNETCLTNEKLQTVTESAQVLLEAETSATETVEKIPQHHSKSLGDADFPKSPTAHSPLISEAIVSPCNPAAVELTASHEAATCTNPEDSTFNDNFPPSNSEKEEQTADCSKCDDVPALQSTECTKDASAVVEEEAKPADIVSESDKTGCVGSNVQPIEKTSSVSDTTDADYNNGLHILAEMADKAEKGSVVQPSSLLDTDINQGFTRKYIHQEEKFLSLNKKTKHIDSDSSDNSDCGLTIDASTPGRDENSRSPHAAAEDKPKPQKTTDHSIISILTKDAKVSRAPEQVQKKKQASLHLKQKEQNAAIDLSQRPAHSGVEPLKVRTKAERKEAQMFPVVQSENNKSPAPATVSPRNRKRKGTSPSKRTQLKTQYDEIVIPVSTLAARFSQRAPSDEGIAEVPKKRGRFSSEHAEAKPEARTKGGKNQSKGGTKDKLFKRENVNKLVEAITACAKSGESPEDAEKTEIQEADVPETINVDPPAKGRSRSKKNKASEAKQSNAARELITSKMPPKKRETRRSLEDAPSPILQEAVVKIIKSAAELKRPPKKAEAAPKRTTKAAKQTRVQSCRRSPRHAHRYSDEAQTDLNSEREMDEKKINIDNCGVRKTTRKPRSKRGEVASIVKETKPKEEAMKEDVDSEVSVVKKKMEACATEEVASGSGGNLELATPLKEVEEMKENEGAESRETDGISEEIEREELNKGEARLGKDTNEVPAENLQDQLKETEVMEVNSIEDTSNTHLEKSETKESENVEVHSEDDLKKENAERTCIEADKTEEHAKDNTPYETSHKETEKEKVLAESDTHPEEIQEACVQIEETVLPPEDEPGEAEPEKIQGSCKNLDEMEDEYADNSEDQEKIVQNEAVNKDGKNVLVEEGEMCVLPENAEVTKLGTAVDVVGVEEPEEKKKQDLSIPASVATEERLESDKNEEVCVLAEVVVESKEVLMKENASYPENTKSIVPAVIESEASEQSTCISADSVPTPLPIDNNDMKTSQDPELSSPDMTKVYDDNSESSVLPDDKQQRREGEDDHEMEIVTVIEMVPNPEAAIVVDTKAAVEESAILATNNISADVPENLPPPHAVAIEDIPLPPCSEPEKEPPFAVSIEDLPVPVSEISTPISAEGVRPADLPVFTDNILPAMPEEGTSSIQELITSLCSELSTAANLKPVDTLATTGTVLFTEANTVLEMDSLCQPGKVPVYTRSKVPQDNAPPSVLYETAGSLGTVAVTTVSASTSVVSSADLFSKPSTSGDFVTHDPVATLDFVNEVDYDPFVLDDVEIPLTDNVKQSDAAEDIQQSHSLGPFMGPIEQKTKTSSNDDLTTLPGDKNKVVKKRSTDITEEAQTGLEDNSPLDTVVPFANDEFFAESNQVPCANNQIPDSEKNKVLKKRSTDITEEAQTGLEHNPSLDTVVPFPTGSVPYANDEFFAGSNQVPCSNNQIPVSEPTFLLSNPDNANEKFQLLDEKGLKALFSTEPLVGVNSAFPEPNPPTDNLDDLDDYGINTSASFLTSHLTSETIPMEPAPTSTEFKRIVLKDYSGAQDNLTAERKSPIQGEVTSPNKCAKRKAESEDTAKEPAYGRRKRRKSSVDQQATGEIENKINYVINALLKVNEEAKSSQKSFDRQDGGSGSKQKCQSSENEPRVITERINEIAHVPAGNSPPPPKLEKYYDIPQRRPSNEGFKGERNIPVITNVPPQSATAQSMERKPDRPKPNRRGSSVDKCERSTVGNTNVPPQSGKMFVPTAHHEIPILNAQPIERKPDRPKPSRRGSSSVDDHSRKSPQEKKSPRADVGFEMGSYGVRQGGFTRPPTSGKKIKQSPPPDGASPKLEGDAKKVDVFYTASVKFDALLRGNTEDRNRGATVKSPLPQKADSAEYVAPMKVDKPTSAKLEVKEQKSPNPVDVAKSNLSSRSGDNIPRLVKTSLVSQGQKRLNELPVDRNNPKYPRMSMVGAAGKPLFAPQRPLHHRGIPLPQKSASGTPKQNTTTLRPDEIHHRPTPPKLETKEQKPSAPVGRAELLKRSGDNNPSRSAKPVSQGSVDKSSRANAGHKSGFSYGGPARSVSERIVRSDGRSPNLNPDFVKLQERDQQHSSSSPRDDTGWIKNVKMFAPSLKLPEKVYFPPSSSKSNSSSKT